jgi:hypothetical protein
MQASIILGIVIILLLIPAVFFYIKDKAGHRERIFRFDFDSVQNDISTLFISVQGNRVTQLHILRSDGQTSPVCNLTDIEQENDPGV